MSTVNSAAAKCTLDEEEIANEQHDRVSNDQSQYDPSEDFPGKSLSHVGQGFMTKEDLTASPRTDFRKDSDDETGSSSTNPVSSNNSFSADIKAHMLGLSAEQKLTGIVDNSNSVGEICQRLKCSLPLAQLINALKWEQNLVKFYPMLKGWGIQSKIPSFDDTLYIQSSKDLHLMKVEELEEKLESAQDRLTVKLKKQHARWEAIPNQAQAKKLVSMSAALAWLDRQCMFEKGTIVSSAINCTLYHGNEVVQTPSESPKELKCPEHGVPDDRGKTFSPIVVESSELADSAGSGFRVRSSSVEGLRLFAFSMVITARSVCILHGHLSDCKHLYAQQIAFVLCSTCTPGCWLCSL